MKHSAFFILVIYTSITFAANPLTRNYDFSQMPSQVAQHFISETQINGITTAGLSQPGNIYKLYLSYFPATVSASGLDEWCCQKFTVNIEGSGEKTIPSLAGFCYQFVNGTDEAGRVFGIEHSRFNDLKDESGTGLSTETCYHVYNAFIDFHGFCHVFANATDEGSGIQSLHKIGDKIIHAAAFSQPATSLGDNFADGSYFKNGEVTLEFKGLSVMDRRNCALIGFDSGDSQFKMIMTPMPEFQITTSGSSHYFGTICKDIKTGWMRQTELTEFVVSETLVPHHDEPIRSIQQRVLKIQNVEKIK